MRGLQKAAVLAGFCVLAAATPAAAQWNPEYNSEAGRGYVNLGVGAQWLEGLTVTGNNGRTASLNYNVGPMGIGAVGIGLPYGFRTEFEYGYRHSSAKNVTLPGGGNTPTSLGLNTNALARSYMVNGYYDFNQFPLWRFIPHIGAGVGAATVSINSIGKQTPFAWQAMAGAEYALTYNAKLGIEYRFLGTSSLSSINTTAASFINNHANYYDNAVLINFRWTFGAPPAPPPAPAAYVPPPAPPAAPPPPPTREFTVYFDFDSTALTPEARTLIQRAAQSAREAPVTHISVVGHTDTVGSAEYNQRLSERRAAVVRAELIKDGVPADSIEARGVGKTELAVPTANGVKEPRNRRAVIIEGGPGS